MNADQAVCAYILAESDERDLQLALRLAAWCDGYAAAAAQFDDHYERGYTDAQAGYKAAEHGLVAILRQHLTTWDGLRQHFGQPRPGDYPGHGDAT